MRKNMAKGIITALALAVLMAVFCLGASAAGGTNATDDVITTGADLTTAVANISASGTGTIYIKGTIELSAPLTVDSDKKVTIIGVDDENGQAVITVGTGFSGNRVIFLERAMNTTEKTSLTLNNMIIDAKAGTYNDDGTYTKLADRRVILMNRSSVSLYMTDVTLKNGYRPGSTGGAVYIEGGSTAVFTNCSFIENYSGTHGGALNAGGNLTVTNCTFTNNGTAGNGGAINSVGGTLTISGGSFTGNTAEIGNAIHIGTSTTKVSYAGTSSTQTVSLPEGSVVALKEFTVPVTVEIDETADFAGIANAYAQASALSAAAADTSSALTVGDVTATVTADFTLTSGVTISSPVTIKSSGTTAKTITGKGGATMFTVAPESGNVTFTNIVLDAGVTADPNLPATAQVRAIFFSATNASSTNFATVTLGNGAVIRNAHLRNAGLNSAGGGAAALIPADSYGRLVMEEGSLIEDCGTLNGYNGGAVRIYSTGTFEMKGGTIQNCYTIPDGNGGTGSGGGAVFNNSGTITVSGGTIKNCTTAGSGGAVYTNKDLTLPAGFTIDGCSAGLDGGGVWINGRLTVSGATVKNCEATGIGGGVYYKGSGFAMSSGLVDNCRAKSGAGLYFDSGNICNISGGTISNNIATENGGGVWSKYKSTISNATISGNTAGISGGGVYYLRESNASYDMGLYIKEGTVISGNTATAGHGGGVYFEYAPATIDNNAVKVVELDISGGTIENNTATSGFGGGVYFNYNNADANINKTIKLTVSGGTFKGNVAGGNAPTGARGGAVYITDEAGDVSADKRATLQYTVSGGTFRANSAYQGGAIFARRGITVSGGTFGSNSSADANTATGYGGALYLSGEGSSHTVSGATVTGNNADKGGGGLYAAGGSTVTITGDTLIGSNSAIGEDFTAATRGGGIMVENGGTNKDVLTTLKIEGGSIAGNNTNAMGLGGGVYVSSGELQISGGEIITNQSLHGGAVYIAKDGKLTMTGGTLALNKANAYSAGGGTTYSRGGAIYIESTGNTISGGTIGGESLTQHNKASHGGGIYIAPEGQLTVSGDTLIGGNEGADGAGVYVDSSEDGTKKGEFILNGGTLSKNSGTDGGAVVNFGKVTLAGGTISENTSVRRAAVYNIATGELTISGTVITANVSSGHGGGVYNLGELVMTGGEISNHNIGDSYNGGGVYNLNKFTMTGGTISGNTSVYTESHYGGAGIYNSYTGQLTIGGDAKVINNIGSMGVYTSGVMTMTGGEISGNRADAVNCHGGGVRVAGVDVETEQPDGTITTQFYFGTFTMTGGIISNNITSHGVGGGVAVTRESKFYMEGGIISDNEAGAGGGGGICLVAGELHLKGGEISGNSITNANITNLDDPYIGGGVRTQGGDAYDKETGELIRTNYSSLYYYYNNDGTLCCVIKDNTATIGGEVIADDLAHQSRAYSKFYVIVPCTQASDLDMSTLRSDGKTVEEYIIGNWGMFNTLESYIEPIFCMNVQNDITVDKTLHIKHDAIISSEGGTFTIKAAAPDEQARPNGLEMFNIHRSQLNKDATHTEIKIMGINVLFENITLDGGGSPNLVETDLVEQHEQVRIIRLVADETLANGDPIPTPAGESVVNHVTITLGDKATIQNARMRNTKLTADMGGGPAIYTEDDIYGEIRLESGSLIQNCSSMMGYHGGAVRLGTTGRMYINGGTIRNCFTVPNPEQTDMTSQSFGSDGGAVYSLGGWFEMTDGLIENCRAGRDGGALCMAAGYRVVMSGGTIQNCTAGRDGGGLWIKYRLETEFSTGVAEDGSVNNGPKIINNTAGASGGGVFYYRQNISTDWDAGISLVELTVIGNKALGQVPSGAIGAKDSDTGNGGGIYFDYAPTEVSSGHKVYATIKNCFISGNTAEHYGGGVFLSDNAHADDMQVVLSVTGGTLSKNTAYSGGGLHTNRPVTITGVTVGGANAEDGNTAAWGGGLYLTGVGANHEVVDTLVQNNKATNGAETNPTGGGGGMYTTGGASIILSGSTKVINNSSVKNGGGIMVQDGVVSGEEKGVARTHTVIESGVEISGNTAVNTDARGGGIYVYQGDVTLRGTVKDNEAYLGGGVFVASKGHLTVDGGTVTANRAQGRAGIALDTVTESDGKINCGTITLKGNANVFGNANQNDSAVNLALQNGQVIEVVDFTGTVYVYADTSGIDGVIGTYTGTAPTSANLISDRSDRTVVCEDGKVKLQATDSNTKTFVIDGTTYTIPKSSSYLLPENWEGKNSFVKLVGFKIGETEYLKSTLFKDNTDDTVTVLPAFLEIENVAGASAKVAERSGMRFITRLGYSQLITYDRVVPGTLLGNAHTSDGYTLDSVGTTAAGRVIKFEKTAPEEDYVGDRYWKGAALDTDKSDGEYDDVYSTYLTMGEGDYETVFYFRGYVKVTWAGTTVVIYGDFSAPETPPAEINQNTVAGHHMRTVRYVAQAYCESVAKQVENGSWTAVKGTSGNYKFTTKVIVDGKETTKTEITEQQYTYLLKMAAYTGFDGKAWTK